MELAALIVSFAVLVVSGAAAVAAIVQARAAVAAKVAAEDARNESRVARDEAVRLSAEANAAFVRQAEAQEEGNRLAKAALPEREPKLELHQIDDNRWRATNSGAIAAESAQIIGINGIVRADDAEPRGLHVGDSLFFYSIETYDSGPSRIAIEFSFRREDGELQYERNEISLP